MASECSDARSVPSVWHSRQEVAEGPNVWASVWPACVSAEDPVAWQSTWAQVSFQVVKLDLGVGWQLAQPDDADEEPARSCSVFKSTLWQSPQTRAGLVPGSASEPTADVCVAAGYG